MSHPALCSIAAAFSLSILACGGSPSAPSAVGTFSVTASPSNAQRVRTLDGRMVISYRACYEMGPVAGREPAPGRIQNIQYSVLGPDGSSYVTATEPSYDRDLGPRFGCLSSLEDSDLTRPVATTLRIVVAYALDAEPSRTRTVSSTVTVSSLVPATPPVTRLTLTTNVPNLVTGVTVGTTIALRADAEGGQPPLEYQFRVNGFVIRSWDTNPTAVWDSSTLNGGPVYPGGYFLWAEVRSAGQVTADSATVVQVSINGR